MGNLKEAIKGKWREFASDPIQAIKNLGLKSAYGLLVTATVLPFAQAYAADRNSTLLTLGTILGSLGVNLLSNFVQKVFDKALSPQDLETLAKSDPAIQQVLDVLITETESIQAGQAALGENWKSISAELEQELRELRSPHSLTILQGHTISNAKIAAPINLIINNEGELNIYGTFISQPHNQPFVGPTKGTPPAEGDKELSKEWARGDQVYQLDLQQGVDQIETAIKQWRFITTSLLRQPIAAVANGIIGIGHSDGTTFALAPVDPIDNCSVECELRIIDDGNDQSNWAGIHVRAFDFCFDFRLGYLVYLRRMGTVELYGLDGIIAGCDQVIVQDTKEAWTHLQVDVFNSEIGVYVNGKLHIRTTDKTFGNKGRVFLQTFCTHAQFRNFQVHHGLRIAR